MPELLTERGASAPGREMTRRDHLPSASCVQRQATVPSIDATCFPLSLIAT